MWYIKGCLASDIYMDRPPIVTNNAFGAYREVRMIHAEKVPKEPKETPDLTPSRTAAAPVAPRLPDGYFGRTVLVHLKHDPVKETVYAAKQYSILRSGALNKPNDMQLVRAEV